MENTFLTIVTATYNSAEYITELCESLVNQTYQNFQWIVQDGDSSDTTVKIVESYKDRLNISLMSEKDTGVYDAWNKAIKRIEGEWVIFFGADDFFNNKNSLEKLHKFVESEKEKKQIRAETIFIASSIFIGDNFRPLKDNYLSRIKKEMPFLYPGLVHNAHLFETYKYNAQYKIAGDYDFVVRVIETGNVVFYPRVFCQMGPNGMSANAENAFLAHQEQYLIIKKYFGEEAATPAFKAMHHQATLKD